MIGILIFPDFQLLDAAGPISVFEIAARAGDKPLALRVLAVNAGPVRSSSGVEMMARDFKSANAITTLVVAGGAGVTAAARCPITLAFVQRLAKRGVRVASVCSGAYVLAEAGLFDGRRATTHWGRTRDFVARYPKVKFEPDQIFTRDGKCGRRRASPPVSTSRSRWSPRIIGEEIAKETARQLVLYHRRSGGQSQFSSLLELKTPNGRFGALLSLGARKPRRPLRWKTSPPRRHERAAFRPRLCRGDRHDPRRRRSSGCASRSRAKSVGVLARGDRARARRPGSAIPSACGAPSSAPSASRRRRCGARQGPARPASAFAPERTSSSERTRCRRSIQDVPSPNPMQGTLMTDREKILIALPKSP